MGLSINNNNNTNCNTNCNNNKSTCYNYYNKNYNSNSDDNNTHVNVFTDLMKKMHDKFQISYQDLPTFSQEEKRFRIAGMQEELIEFTQATDLAEELDALVDLLVFAISTVERMGLLPILEEAYERVMKANMSKVMGPNSKRENFSLDLQKPPNFIAPDLTDLVVQVKQQREEEEEEENKKG